MLEYPPFAAFATLHMVAKGAQPLKQGQRSPAIAIVQGALIDLGYAMPKTVGKNGGPDGIFGLETFGAVKAFQGKHGLKPQDGIVGKATLAALDKAMVLKSAQAKPLAPKPVIKPPPPRTDHYQLGSADPKCDADPGAGKWNSRPTEAVYVALRASIYAALPNATLVIGVDAVKHMVHYLGGSGRRYTVDLEGMVAQVPSAREDLMAEAAQAQDFVEMLPVGKHRITSRTPEGGYNGKKENWNWYFATGGYSSWGKGEATVSQGASGREYELDFEYKFFDRYNWDRGKSVEIFGITITDEFMGEFHRQGLAQEFDCVGSIKRRFRWRHGEAIAQAQFAREGR